MSGGGKGGKQTSTQKVELPSYVTNAQQGLLSAGQRLTAPFLESAPTETVAGFTPNQNLGFDIGRDVALSILGNPGSRTIPGQAAHMGDPALAGRPATAGAMTSRAASVGGADIQALLNPYISSVVDTTVNRMRGERDRTDANIGAKYAAAGSFGGSREAVQRAALDESFGEQVASTTAQLMAAGYDQATATALANAQMQQQTNLANQSAQNSANQFNAGLLNNAAQFDANARNNAGQFNAQTLNDYALRAAQAESGLLDAQQGRQMSALELLLGIGGQQQGQNQALLDVPWQALERLNSVVPKQTESTQTSTQPRQGGGLLGSILGTGLSILGAPMTGGGSLGGNLLGRSFGLLR